MEAKWTILLRICQDEGKLNRFLLGHFSIARNEIRYSSMFSHLSRA